MIQQQTFVMAFINMLTHLTNLIQKDTLSITATPQPGRPHQKVINFWR
jgi:hypothetical protein